MSIHPIELTVQSLLETPLENLHESIQDFYESQVICVATLRDLDQKLSQLNVQLSRATSSEHEESLKELAEIQRERIFKIKQKLASINAILRKIEEKCDKISKQKPHLNQ